MSTDAGKRTVLSLAGKSRLGGDRPSGFDYLRLVLALIIICFHSVVTSSGLAAQTALTSSPLGLPVLLLLPMFFSLSGFLVAGSLDRSKRVSTFLGLRGLRIFPALAVDSVCCALIVGPLLTTLPLREYFASPMLFSYLLNTVGVIQDYLPGLFTNNPTSQVNGQLWTIPPELQCYLGLALISLAGLLRRRLLFALLVASAAGALAIRYAVMDTQIVQVTRQLMLCFGCGVALYLYRERVPFRWSLFALSAIVMVATIRHPSLAMLAALPAAYVTVFLGLLNPRKIGLLQSGDYSYGLFLYGFPLQQLLVATVPAAHTWYLNALMAIPVTLAFSYLSWHTVEKRALALKRFLPGIGNAAIVSQPPPPPPVPDEDADELPQTGT